MRGRARRMLDQLIYRPLRVRIRKTDGDWILNSHPTVRIDATRALRKDLPLRGLLPRLRPIRLLILANRQCPLLGSVTYCSRVEKICPD